MSHAKPIRGAKLFMSLLASPRGRSPGNSTPGGASGTAVDCRPGTTVLIRSFFSTQGRKGSYRMPSVKRKARVQPPLVLKERGMRIRGDVRVANPEVQVDIVIRAQQKVRRRITGPRAGERECSASR